MSQLQQEIGQVQQQEAQASSISEVTAVTASAQSVIQQATAQAATLKQEAAQIQAAANQLLAQTPNLQTLQTDGQTAVTNGDNDASVAAYQNFGSRFKDFNTLMASYDRLQFFSGQLGSADLNQVAYAAAAEQMYSGQIHTILLADLPSQFILVSFQDQHIWAYQGGQVVEDTAVTTGVRGVSNDGTDFGPMQILHKNHPWTMVSPWPQSSPLWYPNTVVQYASFFTDSGEAIHDASWEPRLPRWGPGRSSIRPIRVTAASTCRCRSRRGTTTGSTSGPRWSSIRATAPRCRDQLSEITTDNQGNPLDPA